MGGEQPLLAPTAAGDRRSALRQAQRTAYLWFATSIILSTILQLLDHCIPHWTSLDYNGISIKGSLGLLVYYLNGQSTAVRRKRALLLVTR